LKEYLQWRCSTSLGRFLLALIGGLRQGLALGLTNFCKSQPNLLKVAESQVQVEANNTAIKNIKRTARGYRNPANYKSVILLRSAVRTAA
jgi:hypothetical protein